jgi:hypothetical protein
MRRVHHFLERLVHALHDGVWVLADAEAADMRVETVTCSCGLRVQLTFVGGKVKFSQGVREWTEKCLEIKPGKPIGIGNCTALKRALATKRQTTRR